MIAETICAAASAAGLGIAAITAYRKRFMAATRILAYALIPIGLVMTGLVKWLAHTAFSPLAWAGFVVLGLAWLLFLTTRALERRSGTTRKERREAAKGARREPVAPAERTPALGAPDRPATRDERPQRSKGAGQRSAEDFSDIEEILKKHGI